MQKLVLLLLALIFIPNAHGNEQICFDTVTIRVTEPFPPVHVVDPEKDELRTKPIELLLKVDCETKIPLIPRSIEQAVTLIDIAIPLSFKSAIVKQTQQFGSFSTQIFNDSEFGFSAYTDVQNFFDKAWDLNGKNDALCDPHRDITESDTDTFCFRIILKALAFEYTNRDAPKGM